MSILRYPLWSDLTLQYWIFGLWCFEIIRWSHPQQSKWSKNSFWRWDHHIVTNHRHHSLSCSSIKNSSSTSWKCFWSFAFIFVSQVYVVSLEDNRKPVVGDSFCSFLPHVSYVVTKPLEPNTQWHIVTSQRMDTVSIPLQTLKNTNVFVCLVFFFFFFFKVAVTFQSYFFKLKKFQNM
jgi:hypothetical protein